MYTSYIYIYPSWDKCIKLFKKKKMNKQKKTHNILGAQEKDIWI